MVLHGITHGKMKLPCAWLEIFDLCVENIVDMVMCCLKFVRSRCVCKMVRMMYLFRSTNWLDTFD